MSEQVIHHSIIGIDSASGFDHSMFIKTFFERFAFAGNAVFCEPLFPTLSSAVDYAIAQLDEHTRLALVKPGNARRFDFLFWDEVEFANMLGYIILFDGTDPSSFRMARSILETFRAYAPFPYLFAANCQGHPDAWSFDDLCLVLDMPEGVPLVLCDAADYVSVKGVVLALLQHLLDCFEE